MLLHEHYLKFLNLSVPKFLNCLSNIPELVVLLQYDIELQKFDLAEKKREIGASENIEYLKAQERLLECENLKISGRINYLIATINLYKAVGGKDYNNLEESSL